VPDQRGFRQLKGIQQCLQPGDSGLAVVAARKLDRLAETASGQVGGYHAEPIDRLKEWPQESGRVTGPVEYHNRRAGTFLQHVNPLGSHLDVAASY
jgi:hypothetical protein